MNYLGKIVADFSTQLAAKISVGDTTTIFESATDEDGVVLASGRYLFTVDGSNSLKEHFSCDLVGTTITNLKSISRQGVETTGAAREHRAGAQVVMVNFAHLKFISDMLDGTIGLNGSTPVIYDATATISDDKHIATKAYVDAWSLASKADATEATKGILRTSVAPDSASNPIVVGDNDPRLPTSDEKDAMEGSSGTPSSTNKFVTADNSALDDNMELDGAQEVAGVKTFLEIPLLPASNPTTANQMARKVYVDSLF